MKIAAEDAIRIARNRVAQSKAALKYAQTAPDQVKIQKAKADEAAAMVEQARAQLAQAKLTLGYTRIVAPGQRHHYQEEPGGLAERECRPETC